MSGFSFSFSKKVQPSKVKLVDSKLRDESTKDDDEETDFVTSVEGQHIKGTKKKVEETKELIIPLIRENRWKFGEKSSADGDDRRKESERKGNSQEPVSSTVDEPISEEEALRRRALNELLEEAGNVGSTVASYDIPLLLQNHIPAGYEEDDNLDVSLRAEQSTLDDYEKFPVEQYGKAMLRGMGWKEEEGIGKTNKGVIDMKEPTLRPKGLGLGAERPQANKDAVSRSSAKNEEAKLVMKIGAYVKITKGSHKGSYGQIQSFDEDNNRVVVKLSINSKLADISKFYLDVVSESEFKTKSKVLNNEKYEEYKKIHDDKDREREREKERQSSGREKRGGQDDRKSRRDEDGRRDKRDDDERRDRRDEDDRRDRRDHDERRDRRDEDDRRDRRDDDERRVDDRHDRKDLEDWPERRNENGQKNSDRQVSKAKSRKDYSDEEDSDSDHSEEGSSKRKKDEDSSKSSKRTKKHKKEKKKKKHRRRSSSSSSSSRSRSRHKRRN